MENRFVTWCYKWLPLLMGCHCRADRSFFIRGRKMPVCARCTGELMGFFSAAAGIFFAYPALPVLFILLIPMTADGIIQALTKYESTNFRRLITGMLFGYALTTLILLSLIAMFRFGYGLGQSLIAE